VISKEELVAYRKTLPWSKDVASFFKSATRLMSHLRDEICPKFGKQIASYRVANNWGRLGVECKLVEAALGQWLFFGLYYDVDDHGIAFNEENQPEFAIFLDIVPGSRKHLISCKGIGEAVAELSRQDFEFNFHELTKTKPVTPNLWRLCFWRRPVADFVGKEVSELQHIVEERLGILFGSRFFEMLSSARPS